MAQSIEDMRGGVDQMQSGLNAAENARQKWSSSKDAILAGNDRSLESLRAMSGQLETLVPHLQTAKEEAEIVHKVWATLWEHWERCRSLWESCIQD